jgi:hypothetical protein
MTSDDQHFLDYLSSVSNSIGSFVAGFAHDADKTVSGAVDSVRHGLKHGLRQIEYYAGWKSPEPPPIIHRSFLQKSEDWISRNRALTAAIGAFIGTGVIGALILYLQSGITHKKRRAKKAKNGARKEVVGEFNMNLDAIPINY